MKGMCIQYYYAYLSVASTKVIGYSKGCLGIARAAWV